MGLISRVSSRTYRNACRFKKMSDRSLTPEYLNTIKALCDQIEFENKIYHNYHRSELGPVEIPQISEEDYELHSHIPETTDNLSDIAAVVRAALDVKKQDSPTKTRTKNSNQ